MAQISIAEAKAGQMAEFASVRLGLDVKPQHGKDAILSKMRIAGFDGEFIEIEDTPAPAAVTPDVKIKSRDPLYNKKMRILLAASEEKGGDQPHFVGVNGVGMYIPRGKECVVPMPYVVALMNAVKQVPIKDDDNKIVDYRDVPRFTLQILGEVS